jgi:hypothetical protein
MLRAEKATLVLVVIAAMAVAPGSASALCAVEGKLELVRLNLDEAVAFVVHVRQPRSVVSNAFQIERPAGGALGDIPVVIQLLNLATPAGATLLAVGDLAACPDAVEMERARAENRAAYSGRLLRVFVKYR